MCFISFSGIISDLFPGVIIPEHNYGVLQSTIIDTILSKGLQTEATMIRKVIQLYETMLVRHGVMLVGPTGGGKTTVYQILADTLGTLHKAGEEYHFFQPVKTYVLNPKSITMGELYGEVNNLTLEWKDGLMALSVRAAVVDTSEDHKWIISDGPVDALWIENLNTVLDDNKMLCLANSERIKLTPSIHMMFEVIYILSFTGFSKRYIQSITGFHWVCFSAFLKNSIVVQIFKTSLIWINVEATMSYSK